LPPDDAPLEARSFAALMAGLEPFEPNPQVAVAVSGGADSLALCLLTHEWAQDRGGLAVALTVDHGLRPESGGEAHQVGAWLRVRGIPHHILAWRGPKPRSNVQAAARAARYELLTRWCRDHGILHLLLAHHLEDQAETFLLRLARGSGVDGLSAMAAVAEGPESRLLRPLLGVPKARLMATLRARGQPWLEDPSNLDLSHARVRIRRALPAFAREGLGARRLAATARAMGRARAALESATTDLLARAATVAPEGYAYLDAAALGDADTEVTLRALARTLMCIGGRSYPPRLERLERLHAALAAGALEKARTLGGCRIRREGTRLLVCREAAAARERIVVAPGAHVTWDGRFRLAVGGGRGSAAGRRGPGGAAITLARLGRDGWAEVAAADPVVRRTAIPAPARAPLPALWDGRGVLAVPHLGYRRPGTAARLVHSVAFSPAIPLAPSGFSVAWRAPRIIC
jgi:tRNA(Ile)-lysidine synthase